MSWASRAATAERRKFASCTARASSSFRSARHGVVTDSTAATAATATPSAATRARAGSRCGRSLAASAPTTSIAGPVSAWKSPVELEQRVQPVGEHDRGERVRGQPVAPDRGDDGRAGRHEEGG